jgi:hypothetical protein
MSDPITPSVPAAIPADALQALSTMSASVGISAPPPPASPEAFAQPPLPETLSAEEVQALREMLVVASRQKATQFVLPEKQPNQQDKEKFAESVLTRKPYAEKTVLVPGKLEVVFRCKTRREKEFIDRQIEADFKEKVITTERSYAIFLANYNLMTQLVLMNGVAVQSPVSRFGVPNFSLRSAIDDHIIGTMPEPMMFMLSGALAQFENRVSAMSREILERNFFEPADLS